MKTAFFHLMPYPELPGDFPEAHRSVWVDIDPGLYDPKVGHRAYNDYIDELEYAAAVGFDAVGVNEHHSNGYGLMPSPNIIAASLSRACPDTTIIVLGDSVALYNPPLRVAEELGMLDAITGGRLVAGFPVGSPMDTIFAYGQNPATVRERYHEGVELITRAWTSDEVFSFNGKYNKFRYVNVWPRPVQQPHPPIWIPGGGSVDTWDWCAENDLVYCYLSYFGYKAGLKTMNGFWNRVRELGNEPNPFQGGFAQFIACAETEAEAWELYREPAEYFFNTCLHVYAGYADPPGYKTPNTVRSGVEGMVERAAREATARAEARNDAAPGATGSKKGTKNGRNGPKGPTGAGKNQLSFEQMVEKGYVILGDPTQVTEKIHELCLNLNVGHLMALAHFGNMSKDLVKYNTKLIGEKVLPELRGLFEDEWEDRWWPKPMPAGERQLPDRGPSRMGVDGR
jgi:alkanesulfonate monooxygenase SsuD/methylene tetrahydromethanopterin reductase-like flavin-dependent oxidoreductase (luciferase family)